MNRIVNNKACVYCKQDFSIAAWDIDFYQKIGVSEPTHCPDCREQRRTLHINQIHLFKRNCDATGEPIITNYLPDSPCKVFSQKYWYSDEFDATSYGRDFDFSRSFFEQFKELSLLVPRPALVTDFLHDENSAYTNYAGRNKNCYMIFDSDDCWDCYYSFGIGNGRNSMDCYRGENLELCYETIDSAACYDCAFTYNSENCTDCFFINNCTGCKNCIMCSNLRQKEYCYKNKKVSKHEFEEIKQSLSSYNNILEMLSEFHSFKKSFPQKFMRSFNCEHVSGNYLVRCKNAYHCYDSRGLWDTKFCSKVFIGLKDSCDVHECGDSELLYECSNLGFNGYNVRFSLQCLNQIRNLTYCDYCNNGCADLFGCMGLKRKQYCILNKQYSREDYERMVSKIIDHMKDTGEWGEFFPASMSPHPYNLTVAQEFFPLSKEEALSLGSVWKETEQRNYRVQSYELADDIESASDDVTKEPLACVECGRNYKIIRQELDLLRKLSLPIPRKCFFCRHSSRVSLRNDRPLWTRKCDRCSAVISTTYSPEQPERVYCESCYLEEGLD